MRCNLTGVTIDRPSSMDLDDGFWLTRTDDIFKLNISVSEVASIIPIGSELDINAYEQIESVYRLNGTAIKHMLPKNIAECTASFLPSQTRQALTMVISFDKDYNLLGTPRFVQSIFRSIKKLFYSDIHWLLRNNHDEIFPMINQAFDLALELMRKRFPERKISREDVCEGIIFDDDGKRLACDSIETEGHIIITEFSILFNLLVAQYLKNLGIPALYRVHKKTEVLSIANYSITPEKHEDMKIDYYLRATSPIRRFSDLVNQRILISTLTNQNNYYNEENLSELLQRLNTKVLNKPEDDLREYKRIVIETDTIETLSKWCRAHQVPIPKIHVKPEDRFFIGECQMLFMGEKLQYKTRRLAQQNLARKSAATGICNLINQKIDNTKSG